MSDNQTLPPGNGPRWNLSVLFSPFLWFAVGGVIFIIYTLWPTIGEPGATTSPQESTITQTENHQTWLEGMAQWLDTNVLFIAALATVVIVLAALVSGTLGVWKDEPVVTKWMVYLIAAIAISYGLYFIFTELLYGSEAKLIRQYNRQVIADRLDPRPTAADDSGNGSFGGWAMADIILPIIIIAGLALAFWPEKKEAKK